MTEKELKEKMVGRLREMTHPGTKTHPGPPCEGGRSEGGRGKPPTEEEMEDLLKEAREWEKRLNGRPTPDPSL